MRPTFTRTPTCYCLHRNPVAAMETLQETFETQPWLDQFALYYHSLPIFPVFGSVHFILTAFALRREPGSIQFAFKHPVASCVMTFIVASSGNILASALVGRPPLECLANGWSVLVGVLSWYFIFFSPLDICYFLCAATPVHLLLYTVEEFGRAKKVLSGVTMASELYPQSMVAMAIVGMLKGSGKSWGVTLYRLVYQPQLASKMELKVVSFTTKAVFCVALAFAFNFVREDCWDEHHLLFIAAMCLIAIRYSAILLMDGDPLNPVQQLFWSLATMLTIEPPVRNEGSAVSSGAQGQTAVDATSNSKESAVRKRTASHKKSE